MEELCGIDFIPRRVLLVLYKMLVFYLDVELFESLVVLASIALVIRGHWGVSHIDTAP